MKYLTREIKLNKNITLGTINRENPEVFYILYKKWIHSDNAEEYELILNRYLATLKKEVINLINKYQLSKKHILDYEFSLNSLKKLNKAKLSISILFKQKNNYNIIEINNLIRNDIIEMFNMIK